jgi:hypothetical protein
MEAMGADVVDEGHNVLLRQAAGDTPLVFHVVVEDVWTVNPFRLYFDLRQNPLRGREQADRLREGDRLLSKRHYSDYDEVTTARCERALVTLLGDIGP